MVMMIIIVMMMMMVDDDDDDNDYGDNDHHTDGDDDHHRDDDDDGGWSWITYTSNIESPPTWHFKTYATLPQVWGGATSGLHRTCLYQP